MVRVAPHGRIARLALIACVAVLLMAMTAAIVWINHGAFVYSLDDPYIHLRLSRAIASGHYGFNMGESSSPSSSIAFPLMLVPFVWMDIGDAGPLLLNALALLGTLWLLHVWISEELGASVTAASVLTVAMMLAFNLVGLVFTGMEHSLQVLAVVCTCIGMWRISSGRNPGRLFWLAVILGPLIRYELLATSLSAVAMVAYRQRVAPAFKALALIFAGVGGFSLFLQSRGLPLLPTSVLAKAGYADVNRGMGVLSQLAVNLWHSVIFRPGAVVAALTLVALAGAAARPRHADLGRVACGVAAAALLVGQVGWFERYEVWALVALGVLALGTWAPVPDPLPWSRVTSVLMLGLSGVMCASYLRATALTPLATANVYGQQFQMSELVRQLGVRSLALNDIGVVGWRNPDVDVLDFAGLASAEAQRQRRCCAQSSDWMEDLAQRRSVEIVMIYPSWFSSTPPQWTKVADLRFVGRNVTLNSSVVAIFARSSEDAARFRVKLRAQSAHLPQNTVLTVVN